MYIGERSFGSLPSSKREITGEIYNLKKSQEEQELTQKETAKLKNG